MLWLEPREVAHFELEELLAGGTGVVSRMQWFAHAPHLVAPVEVDADNLALLGEIGPLDWVPATPLRQRHGAGRVRSLLKAGLLEDGPPGPYRMHALVRSFARHAARDRGPAGTHGHRPTRRHAQKV